MGLYQPKLYVVWELQLLLIHLTIQNLAFLLVAIELTADSIVTQIIEKLLQRIASIAKAIVVRSNG